jgi:hypothetical protein
MAALAEEKIGDEGPPNAGPKSVAAPLLVAARPMFSVRRLLGGEIANGGSISPGVSKWRVLLLGAIALIDADEDIPPSPVPTERLGGAAFRLEVVA